MKNMKKWSRRFGAMCGAVVLATSLAAPAAFADEPVTAAPAAGAMTSYEGTTYTITLYSGNQGTFTGGETQRTFTDQVPGEPLSFEGVTLEVPADSKYYAKGVRLAGLDNERSDKNRDGENLAGTKTPMVAYVSGDGTLVGSVPVTEDADYVVAYGIMTNRVAFTVNYVDAADGTELAESQTFFGDIGDVPATAPAYIENYVPHATLIDIVLSEDETKNVITYRYTRLAEGTTTEPQPDGTVDVVNPDGSRAEGTYTTDPTDEVAQRAPVNPIEATTPGAGGTAERTGTPTPVQPIGAEVPLTTDAGTEVLADDGTPLATPGTETINDDETALASGAEAVPGSEAGAAAQTSWIPWAVAAAVLACAITFILVRGLRKAKEDQSESSAA